MIEWNEEISDDLSGCWLAADAGEYSLCIEHKEFRRYHVWIGDAVSDFACVLAETVGEAKEIAQAILTQHVIDTYGSVLGVE